MVAELQEKSGSIAFLYADDTATLCDGHSIKLARFRTLAAADTLIPWARANKIRVAGEKTQLLVLSQWARDSDCKIRVAGQVMRSRAQLKLLGVHPGPDSPLWRSLSRTEGAHPDQTTTTEEADGSQLASQEAQATHHCAGLCARCYGARIGGLGACHRLIQGVGGHGVQGPPPRAV